LFLNLVDFFQGSSQLDSPQLLQSFEGVQKHVDFVDSHGAELLLKSVSHIVFGENTDQFSNLVFDSLCVLAGSSPVFRLKLVTVKGLHGLGVKNVDCVEYVFANGLLKQ